MHVYWRWNSHAKVHGQSGGQQVHADEHQTEAPQISKFSKQGLSCILLIQLAQNIKKRCINTRLVGFKGYKPFLPDPVYSLVQESTISWCVICINGTLQTRCDIKAIVCHIHSSLLTTRATQWHDSWREYCIFFSLGVL